METGQGRWGLGETAGTEGECHHQARRPASSWPNIHHYPGDYWHGDP